MDYVPKLSTPQIPPLSYTNGPPALLTKILLLPTLQSYPDPSPVSYAARPPRPGPVSAPDVSCAAFHFPNNLFPPRTRLIDSRPRSRRTALHAKNALARFQTHRLTTPCYNIAYPTLDGEADGRDCPSEPRAAWPCAIRHMVARPEAQAATATKRESHGPAGKLTLTLG